jgi:hypothetical protein
MCIDMSMSVGATWKVSGGGFRISRRETESVLSRLPSMRIRA